MDYSNLKQLTSNTRTIHSFNSDHFDQEKLNACLELSLMAPNHKFTFPWKFIQTSNQTRKQLLELQLELKGITSDEERLKAESKFLNPAYLIICHLDNKDEFTYKEDFATLSCSIQLLALALRTYGFGYKWSTGNITTHDQTYNILGLDKKKSTIEGWIWIGKEESAVPIIRPRPNLDQVLRVV